MSDGAPILPEEEPGGDRVRERAPEPVAGPTAGRPDYDEMIKVRSLKPGEPYFVVRAQDSLSGAAVRAYAALAFDAGAPVALVESALKLADAMDAFGPKKLPDADHLPPAEQTRMAWELEQRAWKHRDGGGADPGALMLAQQRGWTDGFNLGARRGDERAAAIERAGWILLGQLDAMHPDEPALRLNGVGSLRTALETAIPRDRGPAPPTTGDPT